MKTVVKSKAARRKSKTLPPRSKVNVEDQWDLGSLFPGETDWEAAFEKWKKLIPRFAKFRGTLGDSAKQLAACLKFDEDFDRLGERIGVFAYLKAAEDQANSASQRMRGRVQNAASEAAQAASFIRPEILAIPAKKLKEFMAAKELARYRLVLERIERYRPVLPGSTSTMSVTSTARCTLPTPAEVSIWPMPCTVSCAKCSVRV